MNKKIKIYCGLFVAVLVLLLISKIRVEAYQYGSSSDSPVLEFGNKPSEFYIENDTVYYEGGGMAVNTRSKSISLDVFVKHHTTRRRELISRAGGQVYSIQVTSAKLNVPIGQLSNIPLISTMVAAIIYFIAIIWVLILAFRIVSSIRKGEIFVSKVARYLEITGIILAALYLVQFLSGYLITQYYIKHIVLAEMEVIFRNTANFMLLITGFALMIISQIILMGKDLKEEQELTI